MLGLAWLGLSSMNASLIHGHISSGRSCKCLNFLPAALIVRLYYEWFGSISNMFLFILTLHCNTQIAGQIVGLLYALVEHQVIIKVDILVVYFAGYI